MFRVTLLITSLALPLLAADARTELHTAFEAVEGANRTHNADAYLKLLTEDFRHVTRSGRIRDRKATYEAVKNGPFMPADLKFEEVSLAIHGDSAVRIQKQAWTNPAGKPITGYLTSVYVKENGTWKLAAMSSTDVPSDVK